MTESDYSELCKLLTRLNQPIPADCELSPMEIMGMWMVGELEDLPMNQRRGIEA